MQDMPQITLDPETKRAVGAALGRIPQGYYIMTAAAEHRRWGVMVSWVQQVSFEPPMVLVALRKGREIVPMIHDSHAFALCQICSDNKLSFKKFLAERQNGTVDDDPLAGIETIRRKSGMPIIRKAQSFLECELVRHIDIDGDHDLYIGLVRDGGILRDGQVAVHLRDNGFEY